MANASKAGEKAALTVGIYGGSGYMGGEVLRLILEHPRVKLSWATSRESKQASWTHPNFIPRDVPFVRPEEITPCDVVFIAAPTGTATEIASRLLQQGCRIIDLGSDFRLRDRPTWERVYGRRHPNWELVEQSVYGIPELYRKQIAQTKIIANPGCFSSAAILALAPVLARKLIDPRRIVVTGLSGTAGMGAEQTRPSHHPEIDNNIVPYNVVDHRHTYEMEQELSAVAKAETTVHFTPAYVPISRGILNVCSVFTDAGLTRAQFLDIYREYYEGESFVQVHDSERGQDGAWDYRPYPWVSAVSGTNYCLIGLDYDERRKRLVVFSALDSMGKGGAHVGVQNMNIMFGLPEHLGVDRLGLHPY